MMDLSLDFENGRKFDCLNCDRGLQKLRNCANQFNPKKIFLNGSIYNQCPRSLTFNQNSLSYIVSLYFNCRRDGVWPNGPSLSGETAFTKELFEFCDERVSEYRIRQEKEREKEIKKMMAKKGN